MNKPPRSKASTARKAVVAVKVRRAPSSRAVKSKKKSKVDLAISAELAPAAAIAVLDKAAQTPGAPPPALDALAAGVSEATDDGKVRVQLMFDSGVVLPVEMSAEAGKALEAGLAGSRRGKE